MGKYKIVKHILMWAKCSIQGILPWAPSLVKIYGKDHICCFNLNDNVIVRIQAGKVSDAVNIINKKPIIE